MIPIVDQITDLIAKRPGIRNAEIADELEISANDIRPMLQSRIANSRIIVDKVQGLTGLVNAYRINPRWTPEDESFEPVRRGIDDEPAGVAAEEDDEGDTSRRPRRAAAPKTRKVRRASPVAKARAVKATRVAQQIEQHEGAGNVAEAAARDPVPFSCAVFHDGRVLIEMGAVDMVLQAVDARSLYEHMGRFFE